VELAETTVKNDYAADFKAVVQVYQCWWRICQEINVLSRFEYHMFYILYPFVPCLLALLHSCIIYIKWKYCVILSKLAEVIMLLYCI
jgi:hypothetical protein